LAAKETRWSDAHFGFDAAIAWRQTTGLPDPSFGAWGAIITNLGGDGGFKALQTRDGWPAGVQRRLEHRPGAL
jgi:hypothetical protein